MPANTFVTLTIPSSPNTGPAADVSALVFGMALIVTAPPDSDGEIVVEGSEDGTNFAPVMSVFPLQNPASITIEAVAHYLRVHRLSGSGAAAAAVGSATAGIANAFVTLGYTEVDTSALGPLKTIVCSGTYDYRGRGVVVEGTTDGTNYDVVAQFDTGDSDFVSVQGAWSGMRLRTGYAAPSGGVAVGAGYPAGASTGGGEGGTAPYVFSSRAAHAQAMIFSGGSGGSPPADYILGCEWEVPIDLICGSNPNLSIQLLGIGQSTTTNDGSAAAEIWTSSTIPNSLNGDEQTDTMIGFPADTSALGVEGDVVIIPKPSTNLLQVAARQAFDPGESSTVGFSFWGVVVVLQGST